MVFQKPRRECVALATEAECEAKRSLLHLQKPVIARILGFGTVESYDPLTDTWTRKADMPTARWGLATGVVNGKIYAIGGGNAARDVVYNTVEIYNPQGDLNEPFAVSPQGKLATMWGKIKGNFR